MTKSIAQCPRCTWTSTPRDFKHPTSFERHSYGYYVTEQEIEQHLKDAHPFYRQWVKVKVYRLRRSIKKARS